MILLTCWIMAAANRTIAQPMFFSDNISGVEIDMIWVNGGTFLRGSANNVRSKLPGRQIVVGSYYLATTEVTAEAYCVFLNEMGNQTEGGESWVLLDGLPNRNPCPVYQFGSRFYVRPDCEHQPMTYVSWYGAAAYCQWLSRKTGRPYRLPTEAEWEFAAAGSPNKRTVYAGTNHEPDLWMYAWFNRNSDGHPQPVGSKRPNSLGFYDMSGNVLEWCSDWYLSTYYLDCPPDDPQGPESGFNKVLRGGSYRDHSLLITTFNRTFYGPASRHYTIGFRVACAAK